MCRDFSLINRPPPAAMAAWSRQFASGLVRLFTQSVWRWILYCLKQVVHCASGLQVRHWERRRNKVNAIHQVIGVLYQS